MRISCSRAIKGVKSVELYRNRKIFKSTRKKKIFAQYSLMARVHVALQYLCGSATTHVNLHCQLTFACDRPVPLVKFTIARQEKKNEEVAAS